MTDLLPEVPRTAVDPRRWAGLAVLAASLLVVVMDMTVLNVALPDLTADLGAGALAQLWIVDVYALVLAGLLVPVAALADRWGRRRMLLTGFVVFALASLAALAARSPGDVIAVRALLGIGGAMIMPATLSLIRRCSPMRVSVPSLSGSGPRWPPSVAPSVRSSAERCSMRSVGRLPSWSMCP